MKRVAVKVAYLGENFHGSQRQPESRGLRTVESEMLDKILLVDKVSPGQVDLRFASRTDAGVSALGNVVCFHTEFEDNDLLLRALNSVSDGVYYRAWAEVPEWFNPRMAAKRSYRYTCPSHRIDFERFAEAAKIFEGHHDFKRFAKVEEKYRNTVMAIDSVETRMGDGVIETDFVADYFLWNMIRRIMAAVMQVGKGTTTVDDVLSKLDGDDGTFGLAKPGGLTLLDVSYGDVAFSHPIRCPYEKSIRQDTYRDALDSAFHGALRSYYFDRAWHDLPGREVEGGRSPLKGFLQRLDLGLP